ncbi:hypothetical protein LIER_44107 [Lithospermum erythrorhizon]|uniref:Secreted protein n=1 Tax=Lithospermum erythrorhizon TaxID=34254 RepID=A0AAV3PS67_LITER
MESSLLWRAFLSTTIVAIVLRTLIDVCHTGKCGLFGTGGLIMYDVTANITYHLVDVPSVLLLRGCKRCPGKHIQLFAGQGSSPVQSNPWV